MTTLVHARPRFGARLRVPIAVIIVVGSTLAAFHYSFLSLARGLTLQTPLAYLGVVPVIALLLAVVRLTARQAPGASSALPLDFALGRTFGVLLIVVSSTMLLLVPVSIRFWLLRLDLLSLPLFVTGMVMLVGGVRRAWHLRFPIAFLFLAWPVPYLPLIGQLLEWSTAATVMVVAGITAFVPVAEYTGREGVFLLEHGGQAFSLSVASACAGVNSLVGFGIIGLAVSSVVRGRLPGRLAWLLTGLALVWLLNVARIVAILAAGTMFGRGAALDVLHPFAGLVLFNVAVLVMLVALHPFGLSIVARASGDQPSPSPAPESPLVGRRLALVMTAVVVAGSLGFVNASYAKYEPLANGLAEPRLTAFNVERAADGWSASFVASYDHAKPFYGETSTWDRVRYTSSQDAALTSTGGIYIDVVSTDDPNALAAYGLEACYRFHGYTIEGNQQIDIGAGVSATLVDYHNPKRGRDWSAIVWEWPYRAVDMQIRYERIVIFTPDGPAAEYSGPLDPDVVPEAARFAETDRFLVALAEELVARQLAPQQVAMDVRSP